MSRVLKPHIAPENFTSFDSNKQGWTEFDADDQTSQQFSQIN